MRNMEATWQSRYATLVLTLLLMILFSPTTSAQDNDSDRITDLETTVKELVELVTQLRTELAAVKSGQSGTPSETGEQIQIILDEIESIKANTGEGHGDHWTDKVTIGGYGEYHVNRTDGPGGDQSDLHRAVLYMGIDFNDWLSVQSEIELEHAFVEDGQGEILFEQLYADIRLNQVFESNILNIRAGRILAPLGIINQRHEPTRFNGVERPTFNSVIIPSTWSLEGLGIYGDLHDTLSYELYLTNGLDATGFNATSGIRGGRQEERPGLKNLSVTGRLDWTPFASKELPMNQSLRLGGSFFTGKAENSNRGKGANLPGDPAVLLLAADFDYTIGRFDFRGELAHITIDDADDIGNNVADEIFGWYIEGAAHVWPEGWQTGMFKESDLVTFLRYEDLDTQNDMPFGVIANKAGKQQTITTGVNFYLTPHFVIKADYQWKDDDRPGDQARNTLNFGIGWEF